MAQPSGFPDTAIETNESPSLKTAWHAVEGALMAFLASMALLFVPFFTTVLLARQKVIVAPWLIAVILMALWYCEISLLWRMWEALIRGPYPVGLAVAWRQRRYPPIFAVPVAVWWGLHFCFAGAMIVTVELGNPRNGPPDEHTVANAAIAMILAYGFGVAGNMFLLLATNALTHRGGAVAWVWRNRFLIDIIPAVCVGLFVLLR